MTRLRLAPSSPERMAELMRLLEGWIFWLVMAPDSHVDCQRNCRELTDRGRRLMLRWYAQGHVLYQWAHEQILEHGRPSLSDYYETAWSALHYPYQLWPPDGDERLRRELDEKEKERC